MKINAYAWPHGGGIICEQDCPHSDDCANHTTSGDYRSEDGPSPKLFVVDGEVWCDSYEQAWMEPGKTGMVNLEDLPAGTVIKDPRCSVDSEGHRKECPFCNPNVLKSMSLKHSKDLRISEIMLRVQKAEKFPIEVNIGKGTVHIKSAEHATIFSLGILLALEAKEQEEIWAAAER